MIQAPETEEEFEIEIEKKVDVGVRLRAEREWKDLYASSSKPIPNLESQREGNKENVASCHKSL